MLEAFYRERVCVRVEGERLRASTHAEVCPTDFWGKIGKAGSIVDYLKMRKAQLTEEIGALQGKVAELEHAESECGVGSIFTCTLPLREAAGLTPVADDPLRAW